LNVSFLLCAIVLNTAEMSIAAKNLPLPRRDVSRKKLPRRCRDAIDYKLTAAAPLPRWFKKKSFEFDC
jgi:hypothetical protein